MHTISSKELSHKSIRTIILPVHIAAQKYPLAQIYRGRSECRNPPHKYSYEVCNMHHHNKCGDFENPHDDTVCCVLSISTIRIEQRQGDYTTISVCTKGKRFTCHSNIRYSSYDVYIHHAKYLIYTPSIFRDPNLATILIMPNVKREST